MLLILENMKPTPSQAEQARRDAATKALDELEAERRRLEDMHNLLYGCVSERHRQTFKECNDQLTELYKRRRVVVREWLDAHRWCDDPQVQERAGRLLE